MKTTRVIESRDYMDSLTCDISRSAVIAIHLAWLDFSSSLAKSPIPKPRLPVDFAILYQSMVFAFGPDSASGTVEATPEVLNRNRLLIGLSDTNALPYGRRYLAKASELAVFNQVEIDLEYYANLFVACLNRSNANNILTGEISRHSKSLENSDNW